MTISTVDPKPVTSVKRPQQEVQAEAEAMAWVGRELRFERMLDSWRSSAQRRVRLTAQGSDRPDCRL